MKLDLTHSEVLALLIYLNRMPHDPDLDGVQQKLKEHTLHALKSLHHDMFDNWQATMRRKIDYLREQNDQITKETFLMVDDDEVEEQQSSYPKKSPAKKSKRRKRSSRK